MHAMLCGEFSIFLSKRRPRIGIANNNVEAAVEGVVEQARDLRYGIVGTNDKNAHCCIPPLCRKLSNEERKH